MKTNDGEFVWDDKKSDAFKAYAEAMKDAKVKMAKLINDAILFGDSLKSITGQLKASLPEPTGIMNCRCVIEYADWRVQLEDALDDVFGDTNPYTPEFRDSE